MPSLKKYLISKSAVVQKSRGTSNSDAPKLWIQNRFISFPSAEKNFKMIERRFLCEIWRGMTRPTCWRAPLSVWPLVESAIVSMTLACMRPGTIHGVSGLRRVAWACTWQQDRNPSHRSHAGQNFPFSQHSQLTVPSNPTELNQTECSRDNDTTRSELASQRPPYTYAIKIPNLVGFYSCYYFTSLIHLTTWSIEDALRWQRLGRETFVESSSAVDCRMGKITVNG